MGIGEWIRKRVTEYTPNVGHVFVACRGCERVVPYYRLYGKHIKSHGCPHCAHLYFAPVQIPEWKAAIYVAWGFLTKQGDPRMPFRVVGSKYA